MPVLFSQAFTKSLSCTPSTSSNVKTQESPSSRMKSFCVPGVCGDVAGVPVSGTVRPAGPGGFCPAAGTAPGARTAARAGVGAGDGGAGDHGAGDDGTGDDGGCAP